MNWRPRNLGFLLLLYAAVLGYALVAWVPDLVEGYEKIAERHPWLGYAYLAAVAAGALVLGGTSAYFFYRIWKNSRAKRQRRSQRLANPSELSAGQRRSEFEDNLAHSHELVDDEIA